MKRNGKHRKHDKNSRYQEKKKFEIMQKSDSDTAHKNNSKRYEFESK
jgi:hypothetical protein